MDYNDPFVPVIPATREHPDLEGVKSVEITDGYDLILLSTDHSEYKDFDFGQFECPVVDSRNCLVNKPPKLFQA